MQPGPQAMWPSRVAVAFRHSQEKHLVHQLGDCNGGMAGPGGDSVSLVMVPEAGSW